MQRALCPYCRLVLNTIPFRHWSVLLCPRCEGSFYEEPVLADLLKQPDIRLSYLRPALLSNLATTRPPETERPRLDCPICQATMNREPYTEEYRVLVDRCPEGHGVWLNDGELGQLSTCWEARHSHREPGFFEALRRLLGWEPRVELDEAPGHSI